MTMSLLQNLEATVKREFDLNRRILSFEEYLSLVASQPEQQLRGAAAYAAEMMDHFGKTPLEPLSGRNATGTPRHFRFHLFDLPVDGIAPKLVGHENVQTRIYQTLRSFAQIGLNNKMILLHGPNGSAKSTLVHSIMAGMERYSKEPDGALYSFNWIFPVERYTKGGMGLHASYLAGTTPRDRESPKVDSFAHLTDEEIAARLPSEMKDHPLLLIPREQRRTSLGQLLGEAKATELWARMPAHLRDGDVNHRCKLIFETLLTAYAGDLRRVLMHVQVERFYLSRKFRKGLVTIEPQLHVDAQYQQLTMNRSLSQLPSTLQSLNLFSLSGDVVDGNRGIIEFSDLLKRPVDSFKYLLTACETAQVSVGNTIAQLDTLWFGSTNEHQLDAFKEFPDFSSFKARIELIKVPYLLSISREKELYGLMLTQIAGEKPVSPHVDTLIANWSVLTRLKKPNAMHYPHTISGIVAQMTPLEKAKLLDRGEMLPEFSAEEKKILRANIERIQDEYASVPYYEGRLGASPREMRTVLMDAAQNPEFPTLSPLAVLRTLEQFVKRVTEYDYLRQEVKDGYHDHEEFIATVTEDYLNTVDREVRDCLGLYDSKQWEDFMRKYIVHVSHALKKERIKNPITGNMEEPDAMVLEEFERIVGAPADAEALRTFRNNIIGQVGAWSLDNVSKPVVYERIFPDFWKKLENFYFEKQKHLLTQMADAVRVFGTDQEHDSPLEAITLARKTLEQMKTKYGYPDLAAKEAINFLMKKRY